MENIVGPGLSAMLVMVYDLDPTQKRPVICSIQLGWKSNKPV
jgi:hypothetical protein